MILEDWKKGLENHLPVLEALLKKVSMKQIRADLDEASEIKSEEAVELLKEGEVLIKAVESSFHPDIYFSFGEEWIPLLSQAVLGEKQTDINEITQDLVKEFTDNILKIIASIYDDLGVHVEISELSLIKPGQINKSLVGDKFFSAQLSMNAKFEMTEEKTSPLPLVILMSEPDEERLALLTTAWGSENPILSGEFIEASHQNIDKFDIPGFSNGSTDEEWQEDGKGVKLKGQNVEFEPFDKNRAEKNKHEVHNLDLLKDVEMTLSVELGRREMSLGQILQVVKGSVIELEKLAGEPVEILVNGRKIAEGDVVVIDEHFGVRISKLLAGHEKMKAEV